MNLKQKIVFVSLTSLVAVLLCVPSNLFAQAATNKHTIKTIVIDPGHGGNDPGVCFGSGNSMIKEKDIVLSVGLLLGDMIKKNLKDVRVVYTRDKDVFIPLYKRGEIANKANGDLFISIHVNSVAKNVKAPSGAITYIMSPENETRNLDVAMRENDVILYEDDYEARYQGYIPGSPESFIIFTLMQYVHVEQSVDLATIVQKHYKNSTPIPDKGVRRQSLLVLWATKMPGILTELGFMPNDYDRKILTSASGQKKMAAALFNAISEYKAKVEGNTKPIVLTVDNSDNTSSSTVESVQAVSGRNNGIVYRIQVCSSPSKVSYSSATLKPYKGDVIIEKKIGGVYKYYVGECYSYKDASAKQSEVRRTTKDAFMVAFEGDRQISVSDARKKE